MRLDASLSIRARKGGAAGGHVPVDMTPGPVPVYRALKIPHQLITAMMSCPKQCPDSQGSEGIEFLNECNRGSTTAFSTTAPVDLVTGVT